nr:olfactory receptor 4 [Matsumurasca onukii]
MACLIEIIENHMEIIEFVNLLKMCYKPVLLISFQMAALIISFTFLQIVQIEKLEALVAVNVILTALCVLWAFNYAGQSIIDECDKLRFALYNLEWQGKPKEFVSSLRIMMIVSTRPLLLSVGDLYPLSMASYGKILSAAYSYINLLYSIQQGKNSE